MKNLDKILYYMRCENFYKELCFADFKKEYANIQCINCNKVFSGNHGDATGVCYDLSRGINYEKVPFCYKPERIIHES